MKQAGAFAGRSTARSPHRPEQTTAVSPFYHVIGAVTSYWATFSQGALCAVGPEVKLTRWR